MLTHHVCFRALCLLLGPFLAFRPPASSYFPYFLGPGIQDPCLQLGSCSELSQRGLSNTNPTSLTSWVLESKTPAGWLVQRVKGAILESRTTKPNTHQVIPTSHVYPFLLFIACKSTCTYLCSTDRDLGVQDSSPQIGASDCPTGRSIKASSHTWRWSIMDGQGMAAGGDLPVDKA